MTVSEKAEELVSEYGTEYGLELATETMVEATNRGNLEAAAFMLEVANLIEEE